VGHTVVMARYLWWWVGISKKTRGGEGGRTVVVIARRYLWWGVGISKKTGGGGGGTYRHHHCILLPVVAGGD
jgi:hypothetical protein